MIRIYDNRGGDGGYPAGAANDPRAPYNQKEEKMKVSVCVSFTCYKHIDVEVDCPYDNDMLQQVADEETYKERKTLWDKGWEEDEFTVIKN